MGYNYSTYSTALQTMIASVNPDASFTTILPFIITDAEQRIYRELNLLATDVRDYSTVLTTSVRNAAVSNDFYVVNQINVLTPSGSDATTGTRVPLTLATPEMVDMFWPGNTTTGVPEIFGMIDQWNLVLGPSPDAAYTLEVIGTQRPETLSATNPNTFLTDYLPDLFFAASMVFASGYMRNWGTMSSDPQMGTSWEAHYQALKASAETEEATKFFAGASWTPRRLYPTAQPQRG